MHKSRVIVAGSRSFTNFQFLQQKLDKMLGNLDDIEIVGGGAKGTDTLGEWWAEKRGLPFKLFSADWQRLGKSAGYQRNEKMAQYATHLVAFWDGKSRGTEHMIARARSLSLEIRVVMI